MILLTASVRLLLILFAIRISSNEHNLIFWVFFGYLLVHILNDFENNLGQFLMFLACFN
jgi:hypothetical protein